MAPFLAGQYDQLRELSLAAVDALAQVGEPESPAPAGAGAQVDLFADRLATLAQLTAAGPKSASPSFKAPVAGVLAARLKAGQSRGDFPDSRRLVEMSERLREREPLASDEHRFLANFAELVDAELVDVRRRYFSRQSHELS